MARDLPDKLRLAAALLQCASRKELAAAFRTANPRTEYDVDRGDKWLQGRALPRGGGVYGDLSTLLGLDRPVEWLIGCPAAELAAALAERHGLELRELERRAADFGRSRQPGSAGAAARATASRLAGRWLCYSLAWSTHYPDHFVRGLLSMAPDSTGTGSRATYHEDDYDGEVDCAGRVTVLDRGLQIDLDNGPGGSLRLFFTLFAPPNPPAVLAGLLCGTTVWGPFAGPAMARVVCVRLPDEPRPGESFGPYVAVGTSLATELVGYGVPLREIAATDAALHGFLLGQTRPGLDRPDPQVFAELVLLFDRQRVTTAPAVPTPPASLRLAVSRD